MQFQVPQFIEIEDKIFGPLTFKQFLYLTGGAGLAFIVYAYLPLYLAIIPILLIGILTWALTFYKYNGRPFIYVLESFLKYSVASKLYLWIKDNKKEKAAEDKQTEEISLTLPKLSNSRLKDLSWSLDVKDNEKISNPNNE